MVITKQERFKCKVSTASISGIIETLELEIELFIGANTSIDDGPDLIASSQVTRVKGSQLFQLFSVASQSNVLRSRIGAFSTI